MAIDVAVVPVAGRGTRLLPLTKSQPKEMLPVGQKPVVQYVAEELLLSGVRRLLFVTGPGKTAIENHFDINEALIWNLRENGQEDLLATLSYEREQVDYFYTRQRRQLGLGHAVLCARPVVGHEPFVVALGDSIIGLHAQSQIVRRMTEVFERERADAVIAFERVPRGRGRALRHRRGAKGASRLPRTERPGRKAESGRSAELLGRRCSLRLQAGHFRAIWSGPVRARETRSSSPTPSRSLLRDGGRVLGVTLADDERRFDIGNFPSYFEAFFEFAWHDPQFGAELRDYVRHRLLEEGDHVIRVECWVNVIAPAGRTLCPARPVTTNKHSVLVLALARRLLVFGGLRGGRGRGGG